MDQAPAKAPGSEQTLMLGTDALELLDYVSTQFDAVVPQGVTPEHVLAPEFWAHHAVKLQPMNEIRVRAVDGTWVGYYLVTDCSRTWARLHQLSLHRLTSADVSQTQAAFDEQIKAVIDAHEVRHRGAHKWSVVRKADGAVIDQGIQQKDEAVDRLKEHARKLVGQTPIPAAAAATT